MTWIYVGQALLRPQTPCILARCKLHEQKRVDAESCEVILAFVEIPTHGICLIKKLSRVNYSPALKSVGASIVRSLPPGWIMLAGANWFLCWRRLRLG